MTNVKPSINVVQFRFLQFLMVEAEKELQEAKENQGEYPKASVFHEIRGEYGRELVRKYLKESNLAITI